MARIAVDSRTLFNQGAALAGAIRRLEQHPQDIELLRALLKAGASANAVGADVAPLAAAIRASARAGVEPMQLLLDAGADPNFSRGTQPAWFVALTPGVPAAVLSELLSRGADLKADDMAGSSAFTGRFTTATGPPQYCFWSAASIGERPPARRRYRPASPGCR